MLVNVSKVCLLFTMSWISLSPKSEPQKRLCSVVENVARFSKSGLLRLKSGSIRSGVVNMAALKRWVNEGGGFLLSRGENRREQGVFVLESRPSPTPLLLPFTPNAERPIVHSTAAIVNQNTSLCGRIHPYRRIHVAQVTVTKFTHSNI